MARTVAQAGATLALCDIKMDSLSALLPTLEGTGHTAHQVDLRSVQQITDCVKEIVAQHGRIDGLINGAGTSKRLGFLDVDEELYDMIMDVNLKAAFFMGQQVTLQSMRHTGGKIINIASYNSTRICGGSSVYGCAKSGILGLTRSMAVEWGKFNIQANAIAPGFIDTPLVRELKEDRARMSVIEDLTCCRRMAKPEELMGMTVLLLSDASSYMTGQVYNVDGGAIAGGTPWYFPDEILIDKDNEKFFVIPSSENNKNALFRGPPQERRPLFSIHERRFFLMQMTFRWYGEGNDSVSLADIKQIPGVTGIVWALHNKQAGEIWTIEEIQEVADQLAPYGFNMDVVESVNIHDDIKIGLPTRDQYIENYKTTLRNFGGIRRQGRLL